jgi:hypothetical protein
MISVILRRTYKGGVLARDYDAYGYKRKKDDHGSGKGGRNSAVVVPLYVQQEDADLEGGPSQEQRIKRDPSGNPSAPPAEGVEMVRTNGEGGNDQEHEQEHGHVSPRTQQQKKKEHDEHEGYFAMCLDECMPC